MEIDFGLYIDNLYGGFNTGRLTNERCPSCGSKVVSVAGVYRCVHFGTDKKGKGIGGPCRWVLPERPLRRGERAMSKRLMAAGDRNHRWKALLFYEISDYAHDNDRDSSWVEGAMRMVNQKVAKMINICSEEVVFSSGSLEDGWVASAECLHGDFTGKSDGPADVESSFNYLLQAFQNGHATSSAK